jgi:hypothetical protein
MRPILMRWDPIGIADEPLAGSEYDSLIGPLIRMLREGRSSPEIAAWLGDQTERGMGMARRRGEDAALADELVGWWRMRAERTP